MGRGSSDPGALRAPALFGLLVVEMLDGAPGGLLDGNDKSIVGRDAEVHAASEGADHVGMLPPGGKADARADVRTGQAEPRSLRESRP